MADSTDDDGPDCHQCGDPVGATGEQRVVTTVDGGEVCYTYFCSNECLDSWQT